MKSGRTFLIFILLLTVIGVLNYLSRKKLPYSFCNVFSYNQIYSVKEQLRILHITKSGQDSVSILFGGLPIKKQNHFEVFCDGTKIMDGQGPILTMKPFPEYKTYQIKINSADSLTLNIYFPSGKSAPEVTTPSLLIESEDLPGYNDWASDFLTENTPDRVRQIDSYLKDSMKIESTDNSVEKVIKISKYMLYVTEGKVGVPSDTMNGLQPQDQLNCVRTGGSLLYCGNYSYIFSFFANKAGVPARYVECGASQDGFSEGEHVFSEVWLREYSRWAYVDLTDGNVFVRKNGQFLNALDIHRLLRYDDRDTGFTALHYRDNNLVSLPFRECSVTAKSAFNGSNVFHFYYGYYFKVTSPANLWDRVRNFLDTRPYYAIYSDNISPVGCYFYLRLFSNYIFFAGLLIGIFWTIRYSVSVLFRK